MEITKSITGLGVSKGTATGTARYATDPEFKEGDILISFMTVPDNVPIMRIASAIATEIGSITCHASIVARELGKPCIVRVGTELRELANKQVTVDVQGINEAKISWQ